MDCPVCGGEVLGANPVGVRQCEKGHVFRTAQRPEPHCSCLMFQRRGLCWHTGYDPRVPLSEQGARRVS